MEQGGADLVPRLLACSLRAAARPSGVKGVDLSERLLACACERTRALAARELVGEGSGAGIRTPISGTKNRCPAIRRRRSARE